jgi:Protein of unknown function (DUF2442)
LRFADGSQGEVDLEHDSFGSVFEGLRDRTQFAKLRLDPELDMIVWANGADFSPAWRHQRVKDELPKTAAAE